MYIRNWGTYSAYKGIYSGSRTSYSTYSGIYNVLYTSRIIAYTARIIPYTGCIRANTARTEAYAAFIEARTTGLGTDRIQRVLGLKQLVIRNTHGILGHVQRLIHGAITAQVRISFLLFSTLWTSLLSFIWVTWRYKHVLLNAMSWGKCLLPRGTQQANSQATVVYIKSGVGLNTFWVLY